MKELKNVPGLKPEDVVVVKEYSYGEQALLASKVAKLSANKVMRMSSDQLEKQMEQNYDLYAAQMYPLVFGVSKAPFFKEGMSIEQKLEVIFELPKKTGAFLLNEVKEINEVEVGPEHQKK